MGESNNNYKKKTNLKRIINDFFPSLVVIYLFILDTLAGRRAIHLVHEIGLYNCVFESDSEISINAFGLGYRTLLHSYGHIVKDTFPHIFSKTMLWLMLLSRVRDYLFFCWFRWSLFIFIIFMFMIFKFLNKKP